MSTQTFVFDTRMPVADNVSEDDPTHPKNVARSQKILENQANADTRYDISPTPRMREGFAMRPDESRALHVQLTASILVTILSIYFLLRTQGTVVRLILIAATVFSIHYSVQLLEKRTLYNLSS